MIKVYNPTVSVKYKTEKCYCSCCDQKLPTPQVSKEMEFLISREGAMYYAEWKEIAEYPEDLENIVPQYVYETIFFHATSSYEKVIIEDSEIEKVKKFILREVVA